MNNKDLIINTEKQAINIALLEEGKLLELHQEVFDKNFYVGDIYLGIVKKILHALNAAIIDIGYYKGGFLHYNDLGEHIKNLSNFTKKNKKDYCDLIKNSIENILCLGQKILVQISKEPISNKGPKLTTKISLPGRNLILIPFSNKIYASKKIKSIKEKNILISYIEKIKPKNIGCIIRTESSRKKEILNKELIHLMKKWKNILKNITLKKNPIKIFSESNITSCFLRDTFNNDFQSIYCDNIFLCKEMYSYLSIIAPKKTSIIKYHQESTPIFEKYGVEKQIEIFLGKNVPLKNGAYLVIEHTEALHVIDVNSGMNNHIKENSTELERIDNIFKINLLAATEIARQLRLRDMGGIIVVDFIDMSDSIQKNKLYEHLKEKMKGDRAKHHILPINEFGLVQFTRHRVRPEIKIKRNVKYTKNSSISYILHLECVIGNILKNENYKKIQLHIHTFVSSYLKIGFPSIQQKWFLKYKKWVKIIPNNSFQYTEYKIFEKNNKDEITSYFF
ncbi:Rne/Rng family ribonuclease [Blattabacterium cuenoti]|uniref:Rne/Rng family ribonuclease n=1 Tax=Blattabacterium cuenoti TaxID=1653831 RepID=UPI00163B9422|nr:Rne/Rng family ribonuclease [Blattabacterium cuenoti]